MRHVEIGIGSRRALRENIIAAAAQLDICTAIADQTIVGPETAPHAQDTCVVAVVDDALFQQYLWRRTSRWRFHDNGLGCIFYHGIFQIVSAAGRLKIDARPRTGEGIVGRIEPVALKIYAGAVVMVAVHEQTPGYQHGSIGVEIYFAARRYGQLGVGIHRQTAQYHIRQLVIPGGVAGEDLVVEKMGILSPGFQLYIVLRAVVGDLDAVLYHEGKPRSL